MTELKGKLSVTSLRHPEVLLATGFGVGLVPIAPGTVGSVVALPVWWFVLADLSILIQLLILAGLFALGSWITERACRKTGAGDAGAIVFDEFVGVWIALLAAPKTVPGLVLGFALFRLFDIAKPWPVSWADRRVKGGFGIMLDDVLAGVLAATVLLVAVAWLGAETFVLSRV